MTTAVDTALQLTLGSVSPRTPDGTQSTFCLSLRYAPKTLPLLPHWLKGLWHPGIWPQRQWDRQRLPLGPPPKKFPAGLTQPPAFPV